MHRSLLLLAFVVLLVTTHPAPAPVTVLPATPKPKPAPTPKPKPTPEPAIDLHEFVGKWRGTIKGGTTITVNGRSSTNKVQLDWVYTINADRQVEWVSVNDPSLHDTFRVSQRNGDTITVHHRSGNDVAFTLSPDGKSLLYRDYSNADGMVSDFTGTFRRVK